MSDRTCLPRLATSVRAAAHAAYEARKVSPDEYMSLYWLALALEMKRLDVLEDCACCPCCKGAV